VRVSTPPFAHGGEGIRPSTRRVPWIAREGPPLRSARATSSS